MHESLTYVPLPVSNLMGFADWVQLSTRSFGIPCSRNARVEPRSLPAPESAIHSRLKESVVLALIATLWLLDTNAGDANRAAGCADNCG